jgi:hypothetical protein
MRIFFLIFLTFSCNSQETKVASSQPGEATYFSPTEVIATINSLMAIIDWPLETVSHQKNLSVTPDAAKKLMLPIHPLWDDKISEVAQMISEWDEAKIKTTVGECAKRCECEFYQEVLDRNPDLLQEGNPDLKNLAGLKIIKTKESILNCMGAIPPIQKLLEFLQKEVKNYEAEAVK